MSHAAGAASTSRSSHPRTLVVAVNPTAAFGAHRDAGDRAVAAYRQRGHTVTVVVAADFDALVEATREALRSPPDALVVVGGDGMTNLGTTLLAHTTIPLGIIPCGTGNDLARGLGLPVNDVPAAVEESLDALDRGPRVIDAATATFTGGEVRWFVGVLSAGFDAAVNERANGLRRPRGASRYILALLIELVRLRPIGYRLELDGVDRRESALMVSVGNNVSIGGGMRVTPDALLDDGLVDVMVVRPLSRFAFLRIFPRVFAGTHLSDPRVSVVRARSVRIEAEGVVAYADGERMGALPVDITVHPGALRVLAPARRADV
jgi:diacylglycerol kinase (ATP)